jgi:hypothetical protein
VEPEGLLAELQLTSDSPVNPSRLALCRRKTLLPIGLGRESFTYTSCTFSSHKRSLSLGSHLSLSRGDRLDAVNPNPYFRKSCFKQLFKLRNLARVEPHYSRLVPVKPTPLKSAPRRIASAKSALLKKASFKLALLGLAFLRFASLKSAPDRLVSLKSAPDRSVPY